MSRLRVPVTPLDHILGKPHAPVMLVEYGDYQCPFCGAAQPVLAQILAQFGDSVSLVFRHFPLVEIHPFAEPAAESAEFAGSRGVFWQMHRAIFANQHQLSIPFLINLAASLKLPPIALRDALAAQTFASKVQADFIGGVRSGVNGTPTFFVNGTRHDDPYGVASLPSAIERAMSTAVA
ncbi:thioredoxin domain-containing protein [Hyphomicrobium sp. ghe19]|uniref:DsbA family protein n=1 Tax=Hyphomicrobium sp. ghe19 TaxID=2682968 RepID=UPI0013672184|nr:Disulfide bond formation protein D [Hyphomicrobium sp. ghe19]